MLQFAFPITRYERGSLTDWVLICACFRPASDTLTVMQDNYTSIAGPSVRTPGLTFLLIIALATQMRPVTRRADPAPVTMGTPAQAPLARVRTQISRFQ